MSLDDERATKLRRESALRLAAKRLTQAALADAVDVTVRRGDLFLLLAAFASRERA